MLHLFIGIHLYSQPCVYCYLNETGGNFLSDVNFYKLLSLPNDTSADIVSIKCCPKVQRRSYKLVTNAFFLKPFITAVITSQNYRNNVLKNLANNNENISHLYLKLKLRPPDKEIIDYEWCERMQKLLWTRIEIENALFWLSTLGGAFSALGDYFDHWAERAGEISLKQLKLSKMMGDDGLAERSRLYASLALAQKGKLKQAKQIVRSVNDYARKYKDERLNKMCKGVWAKFKYLNLARKNPELINNSWNYCFNTNLSKHPTNEIVAY